MSGRASRRPPQAPKEDKGIPRADEAERAVVGAILISERRALDAARCAGLDASHFHRHQLGDLYATARALADEGEAFDAVTVGHRMAGAGLLPEDGADWLAKLANDVPTTEAAASYARMVIEAWRKRSLLGISEELSHQARNGVGSSEIIDGLTRRLHELRAPDAKGGGFIDGGTFVLDAPEKVPAVWGSGEEVAWAEGEGTIVYGPTGVGKTTVAQQVVLGRLGHPAYRCVLGMPVRQSERRVLYVAADRPRQAQRSMRRMTGTSDRELLHDRLVFWRGPLPFDLASDPGGLTRMAEEQDADTVIIDSLKDVALDLTSDETGARVNLAVQTMVSAGVECLLLHHPRKGEVGKPKPKTIDDVYGSTWITAGAGSVLLLWGEPGDSVVSLEHMKQPAEPVGPWKVRHDHPTGESERIEAQDWSALAAKTPQGLTAAAVAALMFEKPDPTRNEVERARRKLNSLASQGRLRKVGGGQIGGADSSRYFATTDQEEG